MSVYKQANTVIIYGNFFDKKYLSCSKIPVIELYTLDTKYFKNYFCNDYQHKIRWDYL